MVWVEIWEKKWNNRFKSITGKWIEGYFSYNLVNRYNEKFEKVVDFLHRMRHDFVGHDIQSSERVVFYTDSNKFVLTNCTINQMDKIREMIL